MKIGLKHKRLRCECINNTAFLANDYDVIILSTGTIVGACELREAPIDLLPFTGNISYTIFEPYRGRGFAKEAVLNLCDLARECNMHEIWITCDKRNISSISVCESVNAIKVDEVNVSCLPEFYKRNIDTILRYKLLI